VASVLVVILVLAVVAAIAYYSYQRKKQRRLALAGFAQRFGLQYSQDDPFGLLIHDFHLFTMGDGRGCENVVYGTWEGMPVREADYWYYTQSTDSKGNTSRSYKYFTVVIAETGLRSPYVAVAKESVFTRLADHVGFRDIDFESEDFNREFNVRGEDREFVFKLIDARMMAWLLKTRGTYGFEVRGDHLLVYCHRVDPMALVPVLGTAKAFRDHVPRLVWNEFGTGSVPPPEVAGSPSEHGTTERSAP
jgi:hypothetical protein